MQGHLDLTELPESVACFADAEIAAGRFASLAAVLSAGVAALEAARATKRSEQQFSQIFDRSPIPISVSRLGDGRLIAVNESFLEFSGFRREDVLGRTTLELGVYADSTDRPFIFEQLQKHGYLHGHPLVFRTKSGELRDNAIWVSVIQLDGEACVLVMSLDVTDRNRVERQQKELEDQLRQAQKLEALGTLAGGIAHDFNNILGAIIGYAELSKLDHPADAELQHNLGQVLTASGRATRLVRQILSFSRRQKSERKRLELAPIVGEVLELLQSTLPSTIVMQRSIDAQAPHVLANSDQMHQVMMNLCTNAAHAMKGMHGKLRVCLDVLPKGDVRRTHDADLTAGGYVRLIVSDTGHGMDESTQQRIFEPFFTTKQTSEGTGLGLSVVHGIIQEHEGVITVESKPGLGTTFTVLLPVCAALDEAASLPRGALPRGHGQQVLFVDDEPMLGDVARAMIRRLGYRVITVDSSSAAWTAFQSDPDAYDVLVTDLTMPLMTGIELARLVHSLRPNVPLILASGSPGVLTDAELSTSGISEVLSKPLDFASLANVLNKVLRRQT